MMSCLLIVLIGMLFIKNDWKGGIECQLEMRI